MAGGITERHSRGCPAGTAAARKAGARCRCKDGMPSYQAWVWIPQDKTKRWADETAGAPWKGKGARSAAKNWVTDNRHAVRMGKLRGRTQQTLREAVDEFLEGAASGKILKRGGSQYKPAYLRQVRSALDKHVLPKLGDRRLDSITFVELRDLQEELQGAGLAGGTVRNCFVPLKTIYKRARQAGLIAVKPTDDLELPTADTDDRSATPQQAADALAALPEGDRALWATAFYAGLRRGELRALRVENIHENYIAVEHGWDDREGEQAPKSRAGLRATLLTDTLRGYLDAHIERTGRSGSDLLFGETATTPFAIRETTDRADAAWEEAKVDRWRLKDARTSFRTWLDDTTISQTRADRYHGHSDGHVRGAYITKGRVAQLIEDAKTLEAHLRGIESGKVVPLSAAG